MLAIIIILSVLLCIAAIIIAFLWYALQALMEQYISKQDPKEILNYYFEHESVEKYPCTLLLSIQENAEFDGSVFDFSSYEEKNIIGITEYRTENTNNFIQEDGEPQIALLPNQVIYKMKDGSYQWDFRGLM